MRQTLSKLRKLMTITNGELEFLESYFEISMNEHILLNNFLSLGKSWIIIEIIMKMSSFFPQLCKV